METLAIPLPANLSPDICTEIRKRACYCDVSIIKPRYRPDSNCLEIDWQGPDHAEGVRDLTGKIESLIGKMRGERLTAREFGAISHACNALLPSGWRRRAGYFASFAHSITFAVHLNEDFAGLGRFSERHRHFECGVSADGGRAAIGQCLSRDHRLGHTVAGRTRRVCGHRLAASMGYGRRCRDGRRYRLCRSGRVSRLGVSGCPTPPAVAFGRAAPRCPRIRTDDGRSFCLDVY